MGKSDARRRLCSTNGTLCAFVATAVVCSVYAWGADKPNIVLILADDLGYETVGCYGGNSYGTPRLDEMARQGMRFEHAYAMPLCTNTRIQLMTGKYNNRNWEAFGILAPNELTFGHLMKQAGYKTCIAGKWQLTSYDPPDYPGANLRRSTGMHPKDSGFDEYSLWHVGQTEEKGSRYADPTIEVNGRQLENTQGKYGPDIWTDFINDFMQRNQDEPFFVYYSMALPHNPMVPTPDSPEWQDPARRHSDETPFAADMIRYTDKMVGKIVDKLDELNLRENTLILFFSDNGTNWRVSSQLGDRTVRGGKGKPVELGIRVPAIASWKGVIAEGVETDALLDSVDFLPTMLDAAGAASLVPSSIDGVSAIPVMKGMSAGKREWVYIHQDPRPGWDKDRFGLDRLALDKEFKLYEDGRLVDLIADPFEERSLLVADDNKDQRAARTRLQTVLDSMKPYPLFNPDEVPRPEPTAHMKDFFYQDQGGFIVIEAETLPFPRDESWRTETHLPGYTGLGYVRALRDQIDSPELGATRLATIVDAAGTWNMAIRCRTDHVSDSENQVWVRLEDEGPWMIGETPAGSAPGKWQWIEQLRPAEKSDYAPARFQLAERGNILWIAPRSQNIKIDRIVLYQEDQKEKAMDLKTPISDYHPWASP